MPEVLSAPRILISAACDGVGKSLLGLGLAYELRRKKIGVSACVIGPNLSQALIYRRLTGRYVRCLDDRLLSSAQNLLALSQAAVGSDVVLIEGGKGGLYDGRDVGSLRGSDAEMASLLRSPVVLMVDVRGFGTSVGALVRGYVDSARGFSLGGVVFNRVQGVGKNGEGPRTEEFYNRSLEAFGLAPALGALPKFTFEAPPLPRGSVTESKNETILPRQFLVNLSELVAEHVDVERIMELASRAEDIQLPPLVYAGIGRRARIGVTDDSCFHVGFQDNLELLRYFGAELVPFSPLADSELPKRVGALYFTGAYMAEYGEELSRNEYMRHQVKEFTQSGGIIYAEGGGSAYLAREFRSVAGGPSYEGVGVLPGIATPAPGEEMLQEAVTIEESIIGRPGLIVKALSTGEWRFTAEQKVIKTLRVSPVNGGSSFGEGYSPGAQVFTTFAFLHMGSNPELARSLVDAAAVSHPPPPE